MGPALVVAAKDLRQRLRDRTAYIVGIVAPLVLAGLDHHPGARQVTAKDADHLQRLEQTIETIRETAATAISVNLSMVTMQQNETMKRLASIASLLAVPTLIVGVYGMNFDFMPELRWRYGYAFVLGLMVESADAQQRKPSRTTKKRTTAAKKATTNRNFVVIGNQNLRIIGLKCLPQTSHFIPNWHRPFANFHRLFKQNIKKLHILGHLHLDTPLH